MEGRTTLGEQIEYNAGILLVVGDCAERLRTLWERIGALHGVIYDGDERAALALCGELEIGCAAVAKKLDSLAEGKETEG